MFTVPPLKYSTSALSPQLSKEVVETHYNKHTKSYFDAVNAAIDDTIFAKYEKLDDAIDMASKMTYIDNSGLLDNLRQAWNHQFYWENLCPAKDSGTPSPDLIKLINIEFDSFDEFKQKFINLGVKGFGSYWVWFIIHNRRLLIKTTPNSGIPSIATGFIPLLVIDGWEHAYYLQYPADKQKYFESVWKLIDWNCVNERFDKIK